MTDLRFNISLDGDFDADLLEDAATVLQKELSQIPDAGEAAVVPISDGRTIGIGDVVTVIAVAVPAILNVTKAIDAILGTIEKLKKLGEKKQEKSEKSQAVFNQIDPDKILVNVGGRLVPITKLTEADIKQLSGNSNA